MGIALDYRDIEKRVGNIERKLDSLEKLVSSLSNMLAVVKYKSMETDSRVNVMSANIGDAMRLSEDTRKAVNDICGSTSFLTNRIADIDGRLDRIEEGDGECI